ncbi:MAG: hypothetical protein WCG91_00440 [Candidatus Shapirobacteria bacterium]
MKNIKNLVISIGILVLSVVFFAKPAVAATRLSGISVQSACNYQYPAQGLKAAIYSWNVFGWRCARSPITGDYQIPPIAKSVDLSRECRRIYGSAAYAGYTNYSSPYSWGCYR